MTRLFDEQFESVGYDEPWGAETVDAGCTLDEDTNTNNPIFPNSWGRRCLKADVVGATGNDAYVVNNAVFPADVPDTWSRIEIIATNNGLDTAGNSAQFFEARDSSDVILYRFQMINNGGVHRVKCLAYLDGTATNYFSDNAIALNKMYRVEVKFNVTADEFEWRIDGVIQDAAGLLAGHGAGFERIARFGLSSVTATKDYTIYIDNFAIDDAGWIGPETGSRNRRRMSNVRFMRMNRYSP